MFSYSSLLERRRLELFLNSGESCSEERPTSNQRPNILKRVVNYFAGKSHFCYKYEYSKDIDDIEYSLPRTLLSDLKSLRNYITSIPAKIDVSLFV